MLRMNRKLADPRSDGYSAIRVFHRSRQGKRDPRYLFKCGCCDNKFEIYYGGDTLEIGGVMGSVKNWRELLLPLLNLKLPGQERETRPGTKKKERKAATQAKIPDFFRNALEESKRNGTDKLTDKEIQAEIKTARREKRLRDGKSRT